MLLRPLRCAPMMLGGVGYQAGLDEARRKQIEAQRQAAPEPDVIQQLTALKALRDDGVVTQAEFLIVKRKLLGD